MSATLFVDNVPHAVSQAELTQIFKSVGEVIEVHMHRDLGCRTLCGYVTMGDPRDATRAAHVLNGHTLVGQALVVTRANRVICHGTHRRPALWQ